MKQVILNDVELARLLKSMGWTSEEHVGNSVLFLDASLNVIAIALCGNTDCTVRTFIVEKAH